ncbi:folate family ECF transporter S component [Spiroplasma culicicola]|uniref:Folate family ECF transporter S component n=1 Tax=Spiroplasma culicicola AES-1 TaxID=1276246 RepID=W6A5L1_9MOLU|nr:folate family ECF transporter S component [Spiroplasma culicicola]AHI52418.1 hypothetical protein SCULI_v1c00770 [Spiroplasma culicicola AES-1]
MNWYLITNIAAVILTIVVLLIALAMEDFSFKKISLKHLTVISTFGAVSVVLTNIVGYSIPILGSIRLAFGDWIIFMLGMMFGPLCGVISAISIDTLGSVIPNSFGYHAGYMFNKTILGLFGSLVYFSKSNNRLLLKIIILYSIAYIFQSLLFNQIWMMSWKGQAAWFDFVAKIIKLPVVLPIYITVTYATFRTMLPLLNRWTNVEQIWCFRHKQFNNLQTNI